MESYFGIVKTNIIDVVPKIIIAFLVNKTNNELNNELVRELYDNKELFEFLLEETPNVASRRKKCMEIVGGLREVIEILR